MFNQETIDTADRWLATVVSAFFPGLLLLDVIFGKGLFGTPPTSIYEFVLLLTYSSAISYIYLYLAQASMIRNMEPEFVNKLSADKVGIVTLPLTALFSIATLLFYFVIDAIANLNLFPFNFKYALLINALFAFSITFVVSNFCAVHYFNWYKKCFK